MIQNEVIDDFVKLSKMITEKDQRIKELEQQLAIYKQALKLACYEIQDMYCNDYCMCTKEQFLDQAKKELEEQK